MRRWPNRAVLSAFPAERTPPPVLGADPPGGALCHRLAGMGCLFDQAAVSELGIRVEGVEQGVGAVGFDDLGIGDGVGVCQPAVVRLAGEREYPARHRDGDRVGGRSATSG